MAPHNRKWQGVFCLDHPDRPAKGLGVRTGVPLCEQCWQQEYAETDQGRFLRSQASQKWKTANNENVAKQAEYERKYNSRRPETNEEGYESTRGTSYPSDPDSIKIFREMIVEGSSALVPQAFLRDEEKRKRFSMRTTERKQREDELQAREVSGFKDLYELTNHEGETLVSTAINPDLPAR